MDLATRPRPAACLGGGGGAGGGVAEACGGGKAAARPAKSVFSIRSLVAEAGAEAEAMREPTTPTDMDTDLSKNRFGELPVEVTEFCSLERLLLYHNAIRSIPDTVVYLQSLLYLDLSRNQLSILPSSLCQLPLEVLLVSNNKLVSLPEEIGKIKTLAELDVSCNEIAHLPQQIGELPTLRFLNLRRNLLTELPTEVTELCLESLDISSNRISKLPIELRNMTTLVELHLSNNPMVSPPSYLCTRGRVHIFKYLEIQAIKEDKKKGILNEDVRKVHRKVEDFGKMKTIWPRQESLSIPIKVPDANGTCSGSSTPSTISPGDSPNLEDELTKAVMENRQAEKDDLRRAANTKEGMKTANGSPRFAPNSVNKVITNGPAMSPSTEVLVNGNGLVPSAEDSKKPLEHIQTYREYKEALRQQRAQDIYRPQLPATSENPSDSLKSQNSYQSQLQRQHQQQHHQRYNMTSQHHLSPNLNRMWHLEIPQIGPGN